jgi:putative FmdB family regulatory protein
VYNDFSCFTGYFQCYLLSDFELTTMPIYEYRCDSCGFQKEYIQRMSDAKLTDCPECKKATFSKMVTAAGFQLKGGGWYVTDFKSGGSNTNAAANAKKPVEKQTDTAVKSESSAADKPKAEASGSGSANAATPAAATSTASSPAPSTAPASSGTS